MRRLLLVAIILASECAAADEVIYLANAGLLVRHGDTKIVFDPLFRDVYGQYQLLPGKMEADLLAGVPPFDSVSTVFISHNHSDHFNAEAVLAYKRAQPEVQLVAPPIRLHQ